LAEKYPLSPPDIFTKTCCAKLRDEALKDAVTIPFSINPKSFLASAC
jgi:hypothetical protein